MHGEPSITTTSQRIFITLPVPAFSHGAATRIRSLCYAEHPQCASCVCVPFHFVSGFRSPGQCSCDPTLRFLQRQCTPRHRHTRLPFLYALLSGIAVVRCFTPRCALDGRARQSADPHRLWPNCSTKTTTCTNMRSCLFARSPMHEGACLCSSTSNAENTHERAVANSRVSRS